MLLWQCVTQLPGLLHQVNIDQIKIGNRDALAFGFASATNNVKVIANQQ